jgi:hypothetical protein
VEILRDHTLSFEEKIRVLCEYTGNGYYEQRAEIITIGLLYIATVMQVQVETEQISEFLREKFDGKA